jgi:hypothetical protein
MNVTFNIEPKTKIRMRRRDFQSMLEVRPGSTFFCDAGILWLTQAGDQRDYVLSPGQTMTVTKRGKVLVEAMRDADFHVA